MANRAHLNIATEPLVEQCVDPIVNQQYVVQRVCKSAFLLVHLKTVQLDHLFQTPNFDAAVHTACNEVAFISFHVLHLCDGFRMAFELMYECVS
jgi:hypothetical protein